jgi:hypothetical protein
MTDLFNRRQALRLSTYVLILVAIVVVLARLAHHRSLPPARVDKHSVVPAVAATADQPEAAADSASTETQILASCAPHLGPNSALVPNFDVSQMPSPAAVHLKVRLWVNGDGFVTQAAFIGTSVVSPEDQEAAMNYTKGLTFVVPGTPECGVRQIELIGTFAEVKGSSGEWSTVFDPQPRYSLVGTRVVERR